MSWVQPVAGAMVLLLVAATVGPTGGGAPVNWKWEDGITSGDELFEEIPVAHLVIAGEETTWYNGTLHNVTFRFVMSGPGAITHGENVTALVAEDDIRVHLISGYMKAAPGVLRFAGKASGWTDCRSDQDEDGLGLCREEELGTDPAKADTDGDGLTDGAEVDGSANSAYGNRSTDPLDADTDGDGLDDGDEIAQGTDPHDRDTDGGGETDGTESSRGTDPLDDTDDFYGVYASLSGSSEMDGTALDVEWVGTNPYKTLEQGVHDLAGVDLTFQHDGAQWLRHNGTDTQIANGFRVTLLDFRGQVNHSVEMRQNGTHDIVSFKGIARALEIRNISNEYEAVRVKVLVDHDASTGKLHLSTYQVVDDQPVQPGQHASIDAFLPLPFYVEFDIWKTDDLTEVGVYHVRLDQGQHEGSDGAWLIIYNEDPVIFQKWIPFRAPLMPYRAIELCIMTEAPWWCGGFEQW